MATKGNKKAQTCRLFWSFITSVDRKEKVFVSLLSNKLYQKQFIIMSFTFCVEKIF